MPKNKTLEDYAERFEKAKREMKEIVDHPDKYPSEIVDNGLKIIERCNEWLDDYYDNY